jgi:hypothetical protein
MAESETLRYDVSDMPITRRLAPGFPKKLPCLICGRLRRSSWPGDRIHEPCQKERAEQIAHEYIVQEQLTLTRQED